MTPDTQSRFARFWDSDIIWSFRHSPVAIVAGLVVVLIALAAIFCAVACPPPTPMTRHS